MNKVIVRLDHVSKIFNHGNKVIDDVSLDIYEKEFLTLLGPSGCGKTTILRMISGLEQVTEGKVYIDSVDVTNMEPSAREVNTIFQNLAIFPHMNVYDNVAFGLKMKRVPRDEIDKRVKKTLSLVELDDFEKRMPSQLSGGQLQRVAIARGIIMNPKVLLLDESLCSLDLKLKRAMQIELKRIQKRLGITFIYVTHDQDEALTMSDRIVILNEGVIEQIGTPEDIYLNPKTVFVADFIGESNIIRSVVHKVNDGEITVDINGIKYKLPCEDEYNVSDKVDLLIRPENIQISDNQLKNGIKCMVDEIIYDGAITKLFVKTDDNFKFKVNVHGVSKFVPDQEVYLKIVAKDIVPIRSISNDKRR